MPALWLLFLRALPSEVVEANIFFRNTHFIQHLQNRSVHQRRSAKVVFDVLRSRVILEVIVIQTLVDKAYVSVAFAVFEALLHFPVVLGKRFAKTDIELEVRELLLDSPEVINVEQFLLRATSIPVGNFPVGSLS